MKFKFRFEVDNERGCFVEGSNFSWALAKAAEILQTPSERIEHLKTWRREGDSWIVVYDIFRLKE